ncbi:DUF4280 domain-containing protein [Georgenia sp. 311]|uniref:DUF4280 domain-containing protein n=1 Tax=Georgenia wutianyii TaxID=2585135 RepID=A0ABX5VMI2_9MICO|nr:MULTISPECIES: DUF4280 domain-containing protein [Georgenia]QDB79138.1 DUF4280 domain-containing protein [Georgenia wutianyii]TNC19193.1 DUF4280 domain-containing protein [Georgenia sp. 311]
MGRPAAVSTAMLQCSMGLSPAPLNVLPVSRVLVEGRPAATVTDSVPLVNILPFGMCSSPSNPMVAAATAAALGVLTPMPCVPATGTPWTGGAAATTVAGSPALTAGATCACAYGGVVQILNPGAVRTTEA